MKLIGKFFQIVALISLAGFSNAATVSIESYIDSENPAGFSQSVVGSWGFTDRITFTETGKYSLQLTDFGENEAFGTFDYLGAFITSSADKIAGFSLGNKVLNNNLDSVVFDIEQGEYWLNVLAVTNGSFDVGLMGLNVMEYTAVPLPPAFMFMLTSLLGLIAYKRKAAQK